MVKETEEFGSPEAVSGGQHAYNRRKLEREVVGRLWSAGPSLAERMKRRDPVLAFDARMLFWLPGQTEEDKLTGGGEKREMDVWVLGAVVSPLEAGQLDNNLLLLSELGHMCVANFPDGTPPMDSYLWPKLPVARCGLVGLNKILDIKDPRIQGTMTPDDMVRMTRDFNDMHNLGVELPDRLD
jgi:hypothetical protein